jgi:glycosyltransferase involved in cell wall biosynthesis
MKILHVVPSYYPAVRYGGPIRSVHGLAKGLIGRGHEVHVFTTDVDGSGRSPVPLNEPVDMDGVSVWYFPTGLGRRLYRSPMMAYALHQRMNEYDIAHLHSVFLWPTSAAASAARRVRVPYIVAPRGMLVGDLIRRKSRFAKTAWINLLEKRNLEGAAAIHVTSEIEANDFAALGLSHKRTFTIPNGVEMPCAARNSRIAQPLLAELSSGPFILFLGRVNWKKGLDRLIPAMVDVCCGATLVIAGNDEEAYQPILEALAERTGVTERMRFIGPLDDAEKWQVLAQASLLVLPSYSENFGIVALEAMMAGCPVIVTPEVGLANIIRDVGAGLVVDGTPAELTRAINALLQAPEERRKMGEAGRRSARGKFSWDVIATDMEQVYRECVSEGRKCSTKLLP